MKYELRKIESIVNTDYAKISKINKEEFNIYFNLIDSENSRIKEEFVNNYLRLKERKLIKKYIQHHQSALIRLTDILFKKLTSAGVKNIYDACASYSFIEIHKHLYVRLEGLLSYIESYFTKYFNQDDKIPYRYYLIAKREFDEKLKHLRDITTERRQCNLFEIVTIPINEFMSSSEKITFRKLIFLKKLLSKVTEYCTLCSGETKSCKLKLKLISINFNNIKCFSLLTKYFLDEYQKVSPLNKQIEVLSYHFKKVSQTHVKAELSYSLEQKTLKELLLDWLNDEITFLEKKRLLNSDIKVEPKDMKLTNFKITTGFSVSQVAYFIKLLVDVGAITNNNHREIVNFFASSIKTQKANNISPESFRTKFYNTEFSTIEVVKDLIIKMLNKIHIEK